MAATIAGHGALPLSPELSTSCDAVINELAAVVVTLRGGSVSAGKGLVAVQETAARVRKLVSQPRVAPYLYGLVEAVIQTDIRTNFDTALRGQMTAKERINFLASFHHSNQTITRVVQFCAQSLETSYGSRCRTVPLHRLQCIAMLPVFELYKSRLCKLILAALVDMRQGDVSNQESIGSAARFVREMLRQIDLGCREGYVTEPAPLVVNGAAVVLPPASDMQTQLRIGPQEASFVAALLADSVRHYRVEAPKRLLGGYQILDYTRWANRQLTTERDLFQLLGIDAEWPACCAKLRSVLLRGDFLRVLEEDGGLYREICRGVDVSEVFMVLRELVGKGGSQDGVLLTVRVYGKYLRRLFGSLMSKTLAAAAVTPRDRASDDAERAAFAELLEAAGKQLQTVIPSSFLNHNYILSTWLDKLAVVFKQYKGTPHALADYIDRYLTGAEKAAGGVGNAAADRDDDEASVGRVLDLFKNFFACVTQKDEFFANYKASLARRLLRAQFRRTSESQMLARLKVISGNADVYPLNAMIADMDNSDKLSSDMLGGASMDAFLTKEKLKVKVTLVTPQHWPSFEHVDMTPPTTIGTFVALFESFYQSRYPNRKIRWMYTACTASVMGKFTQGPKELSGSLVQASVLLLVDGHPSGLRIPQLVEATGLGKDVVADAVASMYMNKKVNVLDCLDPATGQPIDTRKLSDTLHFRFNSGFKAPVRKLDLPKPRAANKGVDMSQVENLRKELAKIAIVRFMKSRGSSTYGEMMDAALSDLRRKFDAQPPLVKAQLEFLIDREMIRRDAQTSTLLHYIA